MATPRTPSAGQASRPASTGETPRATSATGEAARAARTVDRKKERDKRDRRQRNITIIVAVVVVVALFALMFFVSTRPADAPVPTETAARYADLQQARTELGYSRLGDPAAPAQVTLYCDFDSEACRAFHDQTLDPLLQRVRAGDASLTFAPLYSRIGNSEGASRAAVCAGEQGGFWKMADALYLWLGKFGQVQAFTNNRLLTGVSSLGLNRSDFDGCIAGDRPAEVINAAVSEATGRSNFKGAPAVGVNGVLVVDDTNATVTDIDSINAAIDRAVEQARAAQAPAATAQATTEATAEAGTSATAEASATVAAATAEATTAVQTTESAPLAATESATVAPTPLPVGGG